MPFYFSERELPRATENRSLWTPRNRSLIGALTVLAAGLFLLAGCGGPDTTGITTEPSPSGPVQITVTPTTATVSPLGKQQFTGTVTNSTDTTVIWSVFEGDAGGLINSFGTYDAPKTPGTYHVIARADADASKFVTATITVQ